jgi:hypothetical protein
VCNIITGPGPSRRTALGNYQQPGPGAAQEAAETQRLIGSLQQQGS